LQLGDVGRHSIIAFDPFIVFKYKGGKCSIIRENTVEEYNGKPFEVLRELLAENESSQYIFPAFGGCIGYFGYDLLSEIENIKLENADEIGLDELVVCFYNNGIVISGNTISFSNPYSKNEFEMTQKERIEPDFGELKLNRLTSNFSKTEYITAVERAKEYIRNGDIFQVNLSQRFMIPTFEPAIETFLYLRKTAPAQYSAYLNYLDAEIISTSPECFFKIEDGKIVTRPIKGTIARGNNTAEDEINKEKLLNSEKDLAELTMIVDLERNDIGRVCKFGTVKVTNHHEIEAYSNVFHTVSSVSGELKEGVDFIDCMLAMFPGGSITGAPKVRAMEIIEELETSKRGIYTGSIGYIGFDGYAELNIAIRTIVIKNGTAYFNVGGGIVADSDPEKEYEETLAKGKKIAEALEIGLFETMLINESGEIERLEGHAERIRGSARAGGVLEDFKFKKRVMDFVENNHLKNTVLKAIYRGGEIFFETRANPYTSETRRSGIRLLVSKDIREVNSKLLRHKTTRNAVNLCEMKYANEKGFDDALFLNSEGCVAETSKFNIFLKKDGKIFTPSTKCGILSGTMRAQFIAEAFEKDFEVQERSVMLSELLDADEVYVTNSVAWTLLVTEISND